MHDDRPLTICDFLELRHKLSLRQVLAFAWCVKRNIAKRDETFLKLVQRVKQRIEFVFTKSRQFNCICPLVRSDIESTLYIIQGQYCPLKTRFSF